MFYISDKVVTKNGEQIAYLCKPGNLDGYRISNVKSIKKFVIGRFVNKIFVEKLSSYKVQEEYISVEKGNVRFKSIDGNLYSADGKTLIRYATGKMDEEFTVPEGVTEIGEYAFSGCIWLKKINAGDGIKAIGKAAFKGCLGLKEFKIPEGVTKIEEDCFLGCSRLEEINLPSGITEICDKAFNDCIKISSIEIPKATKVIGKWAFLRCSLSSGVVLNDGLKIIGEYAFNGCSFEDVKIPETVVKIERCAFANNAKLKSAIIFDGVVEMGDSIFENCREVNIFCGEKSAPREWNIKWDVGVSGAFNKQRVTWGYEKAKKRENT